ncbi:SWIM zinc finger family protein [Cohnella cellulosilytica]|uniref:SWIM zinc finger domain-containing protein n=1 Tax=Cohnella cellulosilytica TaxID=986710 RepID=A0ABW2FQ84_9BACL
MNIRHFESEINRTILARGYDYYTEGNVLEVFDQGKNEYLVQVEGSEVYEVEVKLDENGRIKRSVCDCPYDLGPICKHEVAAYYELREMIDGESDGEVAQEQAVKHSDLAEVLNDLSKQQLIEMIVEIAQQDAVLKNSLIFKYSQGSDVEEPDKCKKLIAAIVKKHTGRGDFIDYRGVGRFAQELGRVLEKAEETEDVLLTVDIACLVLEEAVKAFQYADDSNGDIGELANEALERVHEAIEDNAQWEPEKRERLFLKLLQESEKTIFEGWEDFRVALLSACAQFADVEALRNTLKAKIESLVHKYASQEYQKYTTETLLGIWLDVLREYGTAEETEQFIDANLHYSSFRETLINQFKQDNHYDRVVKLALEGEEQDKDYAGLVLKWQKIRYAAYHELQRKEEQKMLAEQLLLAGEFEYYHELRQLAGEEERESLYDRLKMRLKQEESWQANSMYLKLIAEAEDLDELMEYVKENPAEIEEYADRLAGKFENEINAIYRDQIKKTAQWATNRSNYKKVGYMLRRYAKIAGRDNQTALINELRELYRKRPAFMDELDQI